MKLYLEVVPKDRKVVDDLGSGNVKESGLERCVSAECDGEAFVVARLAKGLHAAVFSKLQNEWCLSRANIKSSNHPA